jgi:hypothetical protein
MPTLCSCVAALRLGVHRLEQALAGPLPDAASRLAPLRQRLDAL